LYQVTTVFNWMLEAKVNFFDRFFLNFPLCLFDSEKMVLQSRKQAPKGYIAGLGRGAAGFTTRSDIGPAAPALGSSDDALVASVAAGGSRAAEQRAAKLAMQKRRQQEQQQQQSTTSLGVPGPFGVAPIGYVAGMGRGAGGVAAGGGDSSFGGPESLEDDFNKSGAQEAQYDDDDDEADRIYEEIDERMKKRRKKNSGQDAQNSTLTNIGSQFRELKEQLATVSESEWAAIPDVGDYSLRYKQKRKQDTFTPITDSLLESRSIVNSDATSGNVSLAGTVQAAEIKNDLNSSGFKSVVSNMSGLAEARGTVLGMSLDRMSDSVAGQTVVDPKGYLTSLSNTTLASNAEIGDINKARLLLKSVRDTNPHHGPGWIAAARVEEAAGKTLQARKLIQEGCEACPTNEDVWLEAARLHPPDMAKTILASAVRHIPTSVKLFLRAADLESNEDAKKAVLRKGLEMNPTSVTLWKEAVELEDEENAKILLSVAVEKVPQSVDMWLALAKLETYDNARKVLNQARRALPTERSIWIAAAKLEESQNHDDMVDIIVQKAVKSLAKHDAVVTREQWLNEAEMAEAAQAPITSAAIIKHTIGIAVDVEDRRRTWADDANGALSRGAIATARAILAHSLAAFPSKRSLWMQAVDLERKHGDSKSLDDVLAAASERLPKQEIFWLLRAKEKWTSGDIEKAREILTQAFAANPNSEPIWLAAAKLEWEIGEIDRARVLLSRARERAPSDRVYMKSALLERELQQYDDALSLINQGLEKYPQFPKLYMMGGQICSEDLVANKENIDRARSYFEKGLKNCPNSFVLWILSSRLEEKAPRLLSNNGSSIGVGFTKARSLLELARLKNLKCPELWIEAIRLERRAGNEKLAITLMARALQDCPNSGLLLAENISTAPRPERKAKSADAIKRNPDDPWVITAVASLFASERKVEKARKWFERAVVLNPDLGDTWAKYYAFECEGGDETKIKSVRERCIAADPKHGELWCSIMKDMKHRKKSVQEGLGLAKEYLLKHQHT
jgi:pre-mRNA-processing factor 6